MYFVKRQEKYGDAWRVYRQDVRITQAAGPFDSEKEALDCCEKLNAQERAFEASVELVKNELVPLLCKMHHSGELKKESVIRALKAAGLEV